MTRIEMPSWTVENSRRRHAVLLCDISHDCSHDASGKDDLEVIAMLTYATINASAKPTAKPNKTTRLMREARVEGPPTIVPE